MTSVCDARSRRFQTPIGGFCFDRAPQRNLFTAVSRVPRADVAALDVWGREFFLAQVHKLPE